jgi:DNA-binding XRE family transcriptional regulator
MHIEHFKSLKIHHPIADMTIEPHRAISSSALKQLICAALNTYAENYADNETVSAAIIHQEAKDRHTGNYQTTGYYLRLYRQRQSLTQTKLATLAGLKQHHLSEMENNKRPLGKKLARQLAEILGMDYRKLL